MNKLFISLLVVLGLSVSAHAWDKDIYSTYVLDTTSASIFTGPGYVLAVELSSCSATDSFGSQRLVIYDTAPLANASYTSIGTQQRKTLDIPFPSTNTTSTVQAQHWTRVDFPAPGLFLQYGLFPHKTTASSGNQYRAVIYYKR